MHCPILCLCILHVNLVYVFLFLCYMCPACCPFLIFVCKLVLLLLLLATSTLVKHSISKNQIQLNNIIMLLSVVL